MLIVRELLHGDRTPIVLTQARPGLTQRARSGSVAAAVRRRAGQRIRRSVAVHPVAIQIGFAAVPPPRPWRQVVSAACRRGPSIPGSPSRFGSTTLSALGCADISLSTLGTVVAATCCSSDTGQAGTTEGLTTPAAV